MNKWILFLVVLFFSSNVYADPMRSIADNDNDALDISSTGYMQATVSGVTGNPTLGSGYRDVNTAGTAEAVSGSVVIRRILMKASLANTGNIYVGDSDVSTTEGFPLDAGEVWIGTVDNLTDIWINATVSGDSLGFTYETE